MLNYGGIGSSGKRSLVVGFLNGRLPKTYSQKNYDQLQWAITQADFESRRSQRKIGALEQANREAAEHQLDSYHQRIWLKEWDRLRSFRAMFQRQADEFIQMISLLPRHEQEGLIELVEEQDAIDEGSNQFRESTLDPINEFCEDIQFWLNNWRRNPSLAQNPDLINQTIGSLKTQQSDLLEMMEQEQRNLERMLKLKDLTADLEENADDILTGSYDDYDVISTARSDQAVPFPSRLLIPAAILNDIDLDVELKDNFLREFEQLDQAYFDQLCLLHEKKRRIRFEMRKFEDEMETKAQSLLSAVVDRNAGQERPRIDPWAVFVLEGVYRRAPQDMPKSWYTLYLHLLQLMHHGHARWQLAQAASLIHQYMALKKRSRIVVGDWHRSHGELANRVQRIMAKLIEEQQESLRHSHDLAEQRRLCSLLTQQVERWRQLKMEEAKLNQEAELARMAQESEKLAAMAERQREEKKEKMERVTRFKEDRAAKRAEELRKTQERLAEVKKKLDEQADIDWQRIYFRQELNEEKRKALEERRISAEKEEAMKEERLEQLRRQVRVEAESNLARTFGDTEAWRNHDERYLTAIRADLHAEADAWNEAKPLFQTGGFSSKQIMDDKRIQLEQRLRETGLISSDYGRRIMAQIKPPTVVRKDQLGSLRTGDLAPPVSTLAPMPPPQNEYAYKPLR